MTPRMKKALKQLAAGEQPRCGLPTRQRLVKWGFARWRPRSSVDDVIDELRSAIVSRDWHRPLEITPAGRAALDLKR